MSSYILGKINIDEDKLSKDLQIHETFPKIAEKYDEFGTGFWQNSPFGMQTMIRMIQCIVTMIQQLNKRNMVKN